MMFYRTHSYCLWTHLRVCVSSRHCWCIGKSVLWEDMSRMARFCKYWVFLLSHKHCSLLCPDWFWKACWYAAFVISCCPWKLIKAQLAHWSSFVSFSPFKLLIFGEYWCKSIQHRQWIYSPTLQKDAIEICSWRQWWGGNEKLSSSAWVRWEDLVYRSGTRWGILWPCILPPLPSCSSCIARKWNAFLANWGIFLALNCKLIFVSSSQVRVPNTRFNPDLEDREQTIACGLVIATIDEWSQMY